jgi:hypothetical protein
MLRQISPEFEDDFQMVRNLIFLHIWRRFFHAFVMPICGEFFSPVRFFGFCQAEKRILASYPYI